MGSADFEQIGTGLTVYVDEPVEGPPPYHDRLQAALARAVDGDHEYVNSPRLESVHTIWMELHEDYLQTQQISREQEGSY